MERYRVRASYNASHPVPKPPIPSYLHPQTSLGRRIDDAEIGIFDAVRYFNEGDDTLKKKTIVLSSIAEGLDVPSNLRDASIDGYIRNLSYQATPTASSEASWNSQSGLLAHPPPGSVLVSSRATNSSKNRKGSSSFGRRLLERRCSCFGKKSVDVEEKFSYSGSPIRSQYSSTLSPTFPKRHMNYLSSSNPEIGPRIASSTAVVSGFYFPVSCRMPPLSKELEELPRESLEVFQPKSPEEDVASDASSDLFEIETFSANSSAYHRRDSLDELPKQLRQSVEELVVPSECYAPSEVSVEWSVTTAEAGFDRVGDDCGAVRLARAEHDWFELAVLAGGNKTGPIKKRGEEGLLSCRSEMAASTVAQNPVRFGSDQHRMTAGSTAVCVVHTPVRFGPDQLRHSDRFGVMSVEDRMRFTPERAEMANAIQ